MGGVQVSIQESRGPLRSQVPRPAKGGRSVTTRPPRTRVMAGGARAVRHHRDRRHCRRLCARCSRWAVAAARHRRVGHRPGRHRLCRATPGPAPPVHPGVRRCQRLPHRAALGSLGISLGIRRRHQHLQRLHPHLQGGPFPQVPHAGRALARRAVARSRRPALLHPPEAMHGCAQPRSWLSDGTPGHAQACPATGDISAWRAIVGTSSGCAYSRSTRSLARRRCARLARCTWSMGRGHRPTNSA